MDKPLPPGVRKKGRNTFKVSQEYLKEDLRLLRDNPKVSQEKKYIKPIGKPLEDKPKSFENSPYPAYLERNKYNKAKKYKMEDRLTKRDVEEAENLLGKQGNPAIVKTYEDARENAMINRDIPAMKNGSEVVVGKGGDYIKDLIK